MAEPTLIDVLSAALARAPELAALAGGRLAPLPGRGLAHEPFVIQNAALGTLPGVPRVPRVRQWGLSPERQTP